MKLSPEQIKQLAEELAEREYPAQWKSNSASRNEEKWLTLTKREVYVKCFIGNHKESDAVEFDRWRRDQFNVSIHEEGKYYFNDEVITDEQLYELFKQSKSK